MLWKWHPSFPASKSCTLWTHEGKAYEIPSACLSISPIFWSSSLEPFVGIFQLFFTKLVCHLAWKVIHPDFLKKKSFQGFWGQKVPKWSQNEVFRVLCKVDTCSFSDFLHEVTATWNKIDRNDFFLWGWRDLELFGFKVPKLSQNDIDRSQFMNFPYFLH